MARELPDNRRQTLLIAGAAFAGAIILFALWYAFLRTAYEPAFTDLKSNDAVTIVGELDRLKTPYRLADDGATILVPKEQVDGARIAVLGGDLPLKGAVGFELFNKTDMGLTEFAQKINYQRALQGELARTIMALDEVDTARVHLSLPEAGIFQQDRRPAKAAVTIATKLGGAVDATVVEGIQRLVSSAVPELQPGNVAILDARGHLLSPPQSDIIGAALENPLRSGREQMWASRVRQSVEAAGLVMPLAVDVVSFEADTLASSGEGGTSGAVSDDRKGPLKVTLRLGSEPGAAVRDRLLIAARQAIGFDSALGDVVGIDIDPALGQPVRAAVAAPWTEPKRIVLPPPVPLVPLWPFGLAFVLLLGGVAIYYFARQPRSMTPDSRTAFAVRLKALLEEEVSDVRPVA